MSIPPCLQTHIRGQLATEIGRLHMIANIAVSRMSLLIKDASEANVCLEKQNKFIEYLQEENLKQISEAKKIIEEEALGRKDILSNLGRRNTHDKEGREIVEKRLSLLTEQLNELEKKGYAPSRQEKGRALTNPGKQGGEDAPKPIKKKLKKKAVTMKPVNEIKRWR